MLLGLVKALLGLVRVGLGVAKVFWESIRWFGVDKVLSGLFKELLG